MRQGRGEAYVNIAHDLDDNVDDTEVVSADEVAEAGGDDVLEHFLPPDLLGVFVTAHSLCLKGK